MRGSECLFVALYRGGVMALRNTLAGAIFALRVILFIPRISLLLYI